MIDTLITRRSQGHKHLVAPAPDDSQIALMVQAALRAPDHGELTPFRFKLVRGAARERSAALFTQAARHAGKGEAEAAQDGVRAAAAPLTVAVVAQIAGNRQCVPVHKQWVAVGGAIVNFLNAAHALGFAGKMLSGNKVRDSAVQAAFFAPGETLLGWIELGLGSRPSPAFPRLSRLPYVRTCATPWRVRGGQMLPSARPLFNAARHTSPVVGSYPIFDRSQRTTCLHYSPRSS